MPEFRPASSDCPDAVSYPLAKPARLLHMSRLDDADRRSECGCSSGVEHNLAKVGVEGSNPFARSKFPMQEDTGRRGNTPALFSFGAPPGHHGAGYCWRLPIHPL